MYVSYAPIKRLTLQPPWSILNRCNRQLLCRKCHRYANPCRRDTCHLVCRSYPNDSSVLLQPPLTLPLVLLTQQSPLPPFGPLHRCLCRAVVGVRASAAIAYSDATSAFPEASACLFVSVALNPPRNSDYRCHAHYYCSYIL